MTYQDLWRTHPGKVVVCQPHLRNLSSHQVVSWLCLEVDTVEDARAALARFEQDGVTDCVLISTDDQIPIEGAEAAKFFRVFLGLG